MLEVQICSRSREGCVIPLGRSGQPKLVKYVAEQITRELQTWCFDDETLDSLAAEERIAFARRLRAEGLEVCDG